MTTEQALQFLNFLIENKTVATKQEFVQAQQAMDILQAAIRPLVNQES